MLNIVNCNKTTVTSIANGSIHTDI